MVKKKFKKQLESYNNIKINKKQVKKNKNFNKMFVK